MLQTIGSVVSLVRMSTNTAGWATGTISSHHYYSINSNRQKSEGPAASLAQWNYQRNHYHNLSPNEEREATNDLTKSPITSRGDRSPPTSAGNNNIDLDSFNQLTFASMYNNDKNYSSSSSNNGGEVATPTKSPTPANAHNCYMSGMTGGYQNFQHHQPMLVSPESENNNAGTLVSVMAQQQNYQNYHMNVNQPNMYENNRQNWGHPFAQQLQQHQWHQQQTMPQQQPSFNVVLAQVNQGQNYSAKFSNNIGTFSPPISPLWAPSSPQVNQRTNYNEQDMAGALTAVPPPAFPATGNIYATTLPSLSPNPSAMNPFDEMFGIGANNEDTKNTPSPSSQEQDEADFWANMGFGVNAPTNEISSNSNNPNPTCSSTGQDSNYSNNDTNNESLENEQEPPITLDDRNLPSGGEYYKARITTAMLGAIFSSGRELRTTLYSAATDQFVDVIGDRPVVSFTIDGSAADTAGIGLGHVLLQVNGEPVNKTDDAVRLVGKSPRPLVMEFYIPPNLKVVKTEGQCMVKYDTNSTEAPSSHLEWKPKYVVVGDMLGKPHILYMYRSKVGALWLRFAFHY